MFVCREGLSLKTTIEVKPRAISVCGQGLENRENMQALKKHLMSIPLSNTTFQFPGDIKLI